MFVVSKYKGGDNLGIFYGSCSHFPNKIIRPLLVVWVARIPCRDNPRRQSNLGNMNFDQKVERM